MSASQKCKTTMKKAFILIIVVISTITCNPIKQKTYTKVKYPKTVKKPIIDTYFNNKIIDNYRWLEDDKSEATKKWVITENEVTFKYLNQIPYKEQIKKRLSDLWNYEKLGVPFKEGDYTYFYKNNGLQNHNVLYRTKENGVNEVFLDPNTFSKDGTTSLGIVIRFLNNYFVYLFNAKTIKFNSYREFIRIKLFTAYAIEPKECNSYSIFNLH